MIDGKRNIDHLKQDRDWQIFAARAEQFCRRWSPEDPRDHFEFMGELMGLFREMIITRSQVHSEIASHYFARTMDVVAMPPPAPVIIKPEETK